MHYIHYGGQTYGPYPLEHIESLLAAGAIPGDALYWDTASLAWKPLDALVRAPGVSPLSQPLPPPPQLPARPPQTKAFISIGPPPAPEQPVVPAAPRPLPVVGIILALFFGVAMLILDLQEDYLHVKTPGTWLASCLGGSVEAVLAEYLVNIAGSIGLLLGAFASIVRFPWGNALVRGVCGAVLWMLLAVVAAVTMEALGGFVRHPLALMGDMTGLALAKCIPWSLTLFMFRKNKYP